MNLKDHILLWNHALIEIIDIRHTSQPFSDMTTLKRIFIDRTRQDPN